MKKVLPGLFVVMLLVSVLLSNESEGDILQLSGYTMGTTFQLQFVGIPTNFSQVQIQQDVTFLLERIDKQLFSTYEPTSELSRFNQSPVGSRFVASSEFFELTALSIELSELTGGAFDITIGPVVDLWGFGPTVNATRIPDPAALARAREIVGYQHLRLIAADSTLSKDADIKLDMSAIAKGYAVDKLANYFDSLGITDYFLEVGGELKISGQKPGNINWVPAVERPEDTAPEVFEILNSQGEVLALAGSGDYRNYFEADGTRYSHEIDPRTTAPVTHNLAAAYVIDASAARADALATAFMVLGLEQGLQLAQQINQAVYLISRDDEGELIATFTEQFARFIESDSQP
jgi:thiamine biosynthesis lipoprotein